MKKKVHRGGSSAPSPAPPPPLVKRLAGSPPRGQLVDRYFAAEGRRQTGQIAISDGRDRGFRQQMSRHAESPVARELLAVTHLPHGREDLLRLSRKLAELAVASFSGDNPSGNTLVDIARSRSSPLAPQAQGILASRNLLRRLYRLRDPAQFAEQTAPYFRGVFTNIIRYMLSGDAGRRRALDYANRERFGTAAVIGSLFDRFPQDERSTPLNHDYVSRPQFVLGLLGSAYVITHTSPADLVHFLTVAPDPLQRNLEQLVFEAVLTTAVAATAGGIAINVDVPQHATLCDGVDRTLLMRVLGEVTHNSLKYHRREGRDRFIHISCGRSGRLQIVDNGPGIEDVARALERGRREEWRHADIPGSGLGLALVREFVEERLGWKLSIESRVGEGTTVTLIPRPGDIVFPPVSRPSPTLRRVVSRLDEVPEVSDWFVRQRQFDDELRPLLQQLAITRFARGLEGVVDEARRVRDDVLEWHEEETANLYEGTARNTDIPRDAFDLMRRTHDDLAYLIRLWAGASGIDPRPILRPRMSDNNERPAQHLAMVAALSLDGEAWARGVVEQVAASEGTMSRPAQAIRTAEVELNQLRLAAEYSPEAFVTVVGDYFHGVFTHIAHAMMAGEGGRTRVSQYIEEMLWGPGHVALALCDRLPPGAQAENIRHDEVVRPLTSLWYLRNPSARRTPDYYAQFLDLDRSPQSARRILLGGLLQPAVVAANTGVDVAVDLPRGLRLRGHIDGKKVSKGFAELVHNALKYHDPEKSSRYVRLGWDEGRRCFYVADNGTGIADTTAMWERGAREAERHPGVSGDGLGLATVHDIFVRDLGWPIEVKSRVGEGATFFVTPRGEDIEMVTPSTPSFPAVASAGGGGSSRARGRGPSSRSLDVASQGLVGRSLIATPLTAIPLSFATISFLGATNLVGW